VNVAILISANAEWEAVKPLFPDAQITHTPFGESIHLPPENLTPDTPHLTLYHSGWGKISSAAMMQYVIDHGAPDMLVNLGTCGGFEGCVSQGDVILVEKTFVYDILELMEEDDISPYYASSLDLSWLAEPYPFPARRGVLASADSDLLPGRIPLLKSQGAIAADWESAALAWVAQKNGVHLLILRAVSDVVHEQGSDAYNNYEIFKERTRQIMKQLLEQLPGWLGSVKL
jgi:adenosylhomocysteine nucleosidase